MNAQTVETVAVALIEADYPGEGQEMFRSFAMLPWVERAERVVAALEGLPPTIVSPGWRLAPMKPEGGGDRANRPAESTNHEKEQTP